MRVRARWMLVFGVIIGMVLGGGVAFASHQFSDVPNSNPFHKEIDFIADRNITLGCGGGQYCPKDFVTREEMAAFLERTVRVATPVVLAGRSFFSSGFSNFACKTDPYTPTHEQQVMFSGAVTSMGDSDDVPDDLLAWVGYRVNGGSWTMVDNIEIVHDGSELSMTVPLGGTLWLAPGSSYEFAARINNEGDSGNCHLIAVIYNRMPSTIGLP